MANSPASVKTIAAIGHFIVIAERSDLLSPRDRIPLVDPICAEIVRDIKHLHIGKSQGAQGIVSGLHVWTMAPRAAAAVQNNELRARQGLYALPKLLQSCFS